MDINTAIHDIRNPLNTIAMNAELARLIIETQSDPVKAINALDAILRSCKVCSDRLQDLKKSIEDYTQTVDPAETGASEG